MYRKKTIKMIVDFSIETMKTDRKWHNTFHIVKEKSVIQKSYTEQKYFQK